MTQTITKTKKLIFGSILAIFMVSVFAGTVFSQTTATSSANQSDDSQNSAAIVALGASRREAKTEERVKKLSAAADRLIEIRLRALKRLLDRVNNVRNINEPDRQSLIEDINKNVEGLTALKAKIDANTDLNTLRTDVKSIFSYRIFAVVLPRDYGLLVTYRQQYLVNRLTSLQDKIQAKIDEAKAKNQDTSAIEKSFVDLKKQVESANSQLTIAEEKFSAMKATDVSGAAKLLEAGKIALKAAATDIKEARDDLQKIVNDLKNLKPKSASSSSSTARP